MSAATSYLKNLDYSVVQQCMHCGMCLPTCPTYDATKLERNSPRGRIALMRAIADGRRLSVWRRGTEYVVVVDHLRLTGGREALEAHHPTTGDRLTLYIDELEGIEVVG